MRSYRDSSPEVQALAAARGIRRGAVDSGPPGPGRADDQMQLFGLEGGGRRRRRGSGRNARMAARLEQMAATHEREEAAARRQGNVVEARQARQRAEDARRAVAMLRAGPSGVGSVLAS